jgi:hypothetical protein
VTRLAQQPTLIHFTARSEVTFETYNLMPDRVFKSVEAKLDSELAEQGLERVLRAAVHWQTFERKRPIVRGEQPGDWVPYMGLTRPDKVLVVATVRARRAVDATPSLV